jgi:hypothetical protein
MFPLRKMSFLLLFISALGGCNGDSKPDRQGALDQIDKMVKDDYAGFYSSSISYVNGVLESPSHYMMFVELKQTTFAETDTILKDLNDHSSLYEGSEGQNRDKYIRWAAVGLLRSPTGSGFAVRLRLACEFLKTDKGWILLKNTPYCPPSAEDD